MKITIVYDNEANPGLRSGWGFSCLIECQERLLFDTGNSGENLIYNMKQLHIVPQTIDKVIISHNHWDHTGGLKEFSKANRKAQVFHPKSFSKPTQLCPGIYSTGALGTFIKEQSLVVDAGKGNIVITGCAHPGLERILRTGKRLGRIYGVLGGFHGFSKFAELEGIQLIAPCHCTQNTQQIKQKFPAQFKQIQAGSVVEV